MDSPNPISVAFSVIRAMRVSRPRPTGTGEVMHDQLRGVLDVLADQGVVGLAAERGNLDRYRKTLETTDPDTLSRAEALAYWINLYNAGALDVAAEAVAQTQSTVLRVPGAFSRVWATVAGEALSLNDIEHGKIRRFGDPRIHGALVCGSASCPTLRYEPYTGNGLDGQLDSQMRSFLSGGGAVFDSDANQLMLSRIFLWYGADFVRPQRMPTWIPASKRSIAKSIASWLDPGVQQLSVDAGVGFQSYDWDLSCAIGQARRQ
ncbi:MAG: DUF547 domain-containing protein [bacterium]|nr:DUF547 domain-containing protein [bacterium]